MFLRKNGISEKKKKLKLISPNSTLPPSPQKTKKQATQYFSNGAAPSFNFIQNKLARSPFKRGRQRLCFLQ